MSKNVYFLSDLHLGASYLKNPLDNERRVVRFLDSIKDKASEIYLLGDILDYWYEYSRVVPKGYVRFLGKLAELADNGVKIHWFIGNHDIWIFDYLPNELGIEVVDGVAERQILGKRFFLNHGDGVGKHKLSFRIIRWLFRNKFCQAIYSMLPSCITIPFAHNWSSHSRKNGEDCAQAVEKHKENLLEFARDHASSHSDIHYYIFGHLHIIANEQISNHAKCIILGDWIQHFSYAVFDGNDICIEYFRPDGERK
jgi:UDP-2,3-diacylglucosamine hydrolase